MGLGSNTPLAEGSANLPVEGCTLLVKIFSYIIYVSGHLFFVLACPAIQYYEKGFSQRLLPPESQVVVITTFLANTFQTENQIPIPANLALPSRIVGAPQA